MEVHYVYIGTEVYYLILNLVPSAHKRHILTFAYNEACCPFWTPVAMGTCKTRSRHRQLICIILCLSLLLIETHVLAETHVPADPALFVQPITHQSTINTFVLTTAVCFNPLYALSALGFVGTGIL
jgi:hypothetical protein